MPFKAALTPASAIERLKANDPTLTTCDLTNNAVLQMKGKELMPQLAEALAGNTVCQELILNGCSINDFGCEQLGTALQKNNTLVVINLENNLVNNDGATAIARALAVNRGLLQLNLLNQKGSRFGDTTLTEFLKMFETNVTLLKIIWRLESRQSFRLTKMLTRNNDIDRRIKAGKEYADLLPEGVAILSPGLILQRASAAGLVATPRVGADAAPLAENSGSMRSLGSSKAASGRSTEEEPARVSTGRASSTALPPVASWPEIPPGADLDTALAALTLEKETAIAKLEAEYTAKREAITAKFAAEAEQAAAGVVAEVFEKAVALE